MEPGPLKLRTPILPGHLPSGLLGKDKIAGFVVDHSLRQNHSPTCCSCPQSTLHSEMLHIVSADMKAHGEAEEGESPHV